MLGVRETELSSGIPSVKFTRYSCRKCGEQIWVPGQLDDTDPECANHYDGPWPKLLRFIVR